MKFLLGRFKADNREVTLKVMDVGFIKLTIANGDGIDIIHQNFNCQKTATQTYENLLETMGGQRMN